MAIEAIRTDHKFENVADDSTRMPNIPQEIVVDILTRLPVKSLLRFRCVCKSWLSLFSDRIFIKTHLHISTLDDDDDDNNYSNHRIIFTTDVDFSFNSCSIYSIFKHLYDEAIELAHPIKDSNRGGSIIGSYNGLVCVSFIHENLYLWNPCLRESRRLPHFGVGFRVGNVIRHFSVFGFGYDDSTDDYKVVALSYVFCQGGFSDTEVKVYSLRTNSWRRVVEFPCCLPDNEVGVFVGGAVHWQSGDINHPGYIIGLGLATETYHEVAQPDCEYTNGCYHRLGVLRGCLCVMASVYKSHANLWVMKEYGVKESWTKMVTISYVNPNSTFLPPFDVPLFTSKNSEMLLHSPARFKIYNSKDDTFKSPVIPNFLGNYLESAIYIETLVSPYPGDTFEGDTNIEENEGT